MQSFLFPGNLTFFPSKEGPRNHLPIASLSPWVEIVLLALESHSFWVRLMQGFGALSLAYLTLSSLGLVFCSYGIKSIAKLRAATRSEISVSAESTHVPGALVLKTLCCCLFCTQGSAFLSYNLNHIQIVSVSWGYGNNRLDGVRKQTLISHSARG